MSEFFADLWSDGWSGRLGAALIGACVLLVAAAVGMAMYWSADFIGTRHFVTRGTVKYVTFEPAHTNVTLVGKQIIPVYYAEIWHVGVDTTEGEDSISTDHQPEAWASVGKLVTVEYQKGRFSGVNVTKIEPVENAR